MNADERRPIVEIVRDVLASLGQIVRGELRLVRAQIEEELKAALWAVVLMTIGSALALMTTGLVLWAAVYALSLVMDLWLAALVVAAVVACTAGVLIAVGLSRFKRTARLPRTSSTLREELQWAKAPNS